jgi:hypothetical protein
MLETRPTPADSTIAVEASSPAFIPWRLVELRALEDYQLFQRFADGTEGYTQMKERIFREDAGVFATLRDPAVFAQVSIDPAFGSVQWANGVDIAPDASHADIRRNGVQVLR